MYKSIAMGSQYVSHWLRVVVCVSFVCPHIFFKFCATNFFYTSYVIEKKLIHLWHDEFTAMYSNVPKKELPGWLNR